MSSDKTQLFSLLFLAILAFSGAALFKTSLKKISPSQTNIIDNLFSLTSLFFDVYFWLALLCYGLSLSFFLVLLQLNDLSKIFPVAVGLNILVTLIGSMVILGEQINLLRTFGAGAIILGIFIVYSS